MGTLGPDEVRYKTRMYLHNIQHASQTRVLYVSAIAMTVFDRAVDAFVARLPGYAARSRSARPAPAVGSSWKSAAKPSSGCYLCPAPDHLASNRQFHPLINGRHAPVSDAVKKAVIAHIKSSSLSAADKVIDEAACRGYWSQHSL